ncbi:MAG: hypothetical protein KKB34_09490 [Bacteroidetes bacterium]|nr:hypothetical protein [Bacteroidota bacterium]
MNLLKNFFTSIKFIYFFTFVHFATEQATAQITFENITSDNGLSQNSVLAICEDKHGFIWLGTKDGLNRYDGYNLITYYNEPYDNQSLSGNSVLSITEGSDGNLYIGTQCGLDKLIIDEDKIIRIPLQYFPDNRQPYIRAILEDVDKNLWLGTDEGVLFYNPATKYEKLYSKEFENEIIWDLFQDSRGTIWASSARKIYRYNYKNDLFFEFPVKMKNLNEKIHGDFYEDIKGRLWIGAGKGVYILEKNAAVAVPIAEYFKWVDDKDLKDIYTINGDGENLIWMGSLDYGLFCMNLKTKKIMNYDGGSINPLLSGADNISDITIDKSGRLWIGTNGGGLAFWNPFNPQFALMNNRRLAMKNKSVRAIYKDDDNNVWIGGYEGLDKIKRRYKKVTNYSNTPDKKPVIIGKTVIAIAEDPNNKNNLWLGLENKGVSIFNKISESSERLAGKSSLFQDLLESSVYNILFDSKGFVWLATSTGIYKLNKEKQIIKFYGEGTGDNDLINKRVVFLMEDLEFNIWAATNRGGLVKINGDNGQLEKFVHSDKDINSVASDKIYSLAQDSFGYMWIGTDSGLDKFYPESKKFEHFYKTSGLPNNTIYGILIDQENNLWLSTNDGLSKFNPKTNTFYNYNVRFQLQGKEFNSGAFYQASDGEMFFGGIKGVNSFYPAEIKGISNFPKVLLTNLWLFNERVKVGEEVNGRVILKKAITSSGEIKLNYNQNIIGINFVALEYFGNKNILYAYKLENFEEEWNISGLRKYASYVKLPPGKYNFKVKSTNSEGIWSNSFTSLKIIIHPPIWNTWYIRGLTWVLGIFVLFVIVVIFKKNLRTKQIELEKQKEISEKLIRVDKLKDNFLAQISHEIRTPINSILSYSSLVEEEVQEHVSEELKFSFDSIRNAGQRIIRTVDLILNFSEVQSGMYMYNESVFDFVEEVLEPIHSEFILLAKKKGIVLNVKTNNSNTRIRGDQYSITQIMANLVENAMKYTFDGYVEINIDEKNGKLCVDVNDTGVGISQEFLPSLFNPFTQETEGYTRKFEGNGLGLALVKKYCELNNVQITVQSEKNKGTTFTLEFRQA